MLPAECGERRWSAAASSSSHPSRRSGSCACSSATLISCGLIQVIMTSSRSLSDGQVADVFTARTVTRRGRFGYSGLRARACRYAASRCCARSRSPPRCADQPYGALVGVALAEQHRPADKVRTLTFLASAARFSRFIASSGAKFLTIEPTLPALRHWCLVPGVHRAPQRSRRCDGPM